MRKLLSVLLVLCFLLSFSACREKTELEIAQERYEQAKRTAEALDEQAKRAEEKQREVQDLFDEYNRLQDALWP